MKNLFFLFLLSVSTSCKKECWDDNIDFIKMEEHFVTGKVKKEILFNDYFPEYKKRKREKYKILFYEGKTKKSDDIMVFEKATDIKSLNNSIFLYNFSKYMELSFIPPSVLVKKKYDYPVLLQLFINQPVKILGEFEDFKNKISLEDKSDLYIFNFIAGKLDVSKWNLLYDPKCNKIISIDNDYREISYIKYGDYPFIAHRIINEKSQSLSVKDYENFPLDKVTKLTVSQFFNSIVWSSLSYSDKIKRRHAKEIMRKNYLTDDKIYYVKYKGRYWIKDNRIILRYFYKEIGGMTKVFSRKTIGKLKSLNREMLKKLSNNILSEDEIVGILYRRDIILKESEKINL